MFTSPKNEAAAHPHNVMGDVSVGSYSLLLCLCLKGLRQRLLPGLSRLVALKTDGDSEHRTT